MASKMEEDEAEVVYKKGSVDDKPVFGQIKNSGFSSYTSRGYGCGNYSKLIYVDSKALKQAHSGLRNCFSNADYRQKSTDRNPQL
jgi:hypothetical protein